METLGKRFGFPVLPQEVANFTAILSSKGYIKNNRKTIDMFDIQILISEFIYKISAEFEINYYLDFYLYDLLVDHMKIAVDRLKQGHSIENPLYSQLIAKYPYVFEEVKKHIKSLEEYIKQQFTNDEVSFIVMYIVAVMEKNKSKVKALIVCNSGQGTAQLISARLQSVCKQLEIINISSSHKLKGINEDNVDIVISTVPLKDISIPLVEVNPILTDDDLYKTQSMIIKIQDEKQKYRCSNTRIHK
jgi:transcriptional antiterminator